jgi:transposase
MKWRDDIELHIEPPATGGQPSALNEGRHEAIVKAVREGSYRAEAARLSGIAPNTLYKWLREGEEAEAAEVPYGDLRRGWYRALYEDVMTAEAEYEMEMRRKINAAAESEKPNTWQAAAWSLERKYPERYGRRDTTVIEGGDKPIKHATIHILANPEAQAAANELLKSLARQPVEPARDVPALPAPDLDLEAVEDDDDSHG